MAATATQKESCCSFSIWCWLNVWNLLRIRISKQEPSLKLNRSVSLPHLGFGDVSTSALASNLYPKIVCPKGVDVSTSSFSTKLVCILVRHLLTVYKNWVELEEKEMRQRHKTTNRPHTEKVLLLQFQKRKYIFGIAKSWCPYTRKIKCLVFLMQHRHISQDHKLQSSTAAGFTRLEKRPGFNFADKPA